MIKVSVQDFDGNWETSEFETRQEASDYIHSLDAANAIEIEGVEFEGKTPTSDELTEWVDGALTINVVVVDTDYNQIPTGIMTVETVEQFAEEQVGELVKVDDNHYTLICEWGNGEGADTYDIEVLS